MAKSFQKVTAGDRMREHFTAPTFNRFVDAARIANRLDRASRSPTSPQFRQTGIIKIQNLSGENRERFDILGIDEPIFGPSDALENWQNQVQFKGLLPSADDHRGNFVVLLEGLRKEAVGRAFIAGACACQIDVQDDSHQYADVDDGSATALKSSPTGAAFIVWREGGTGLQWANVVLSPANAATFVPFELTADLTAGNNTTAKELAWDIETDSYSTVGDAFTVFDTINAATLGGKTGDQGLLYHAEAEYRIISQISTIARWFEFTLHATGGDLGAGDTTHLVTVTEYHDGSDPGSTVTVHFEEKWEANVGNVGKALLGSDGNYHNVVVDCLT